MLGAIALCENVFVAANAPDKFQTVFEVLSRSLCELAEQAINGFKTSMLLLQ